MLTVTVTPGAFPASDITSVSVDLSPIGGAAQPFFDDGTHGDLTAGDRVYSYTTVVAGSPGFKVLTGTIGDARGRSSSPTIRLAVEAASTSTIAQIQGAGSISPLAGQFVTTTGIVTAVRSTGYFIQTPDGSGRRQSAVVRRRVRLHQRIADQAVRRRRARGQWRRIGVRARTTESAD